MKKTVVNILFLLAAASCVALSCKPAVVEEAFSIDANELSFQSQGGVSDLKLVSTQAWTATSDNPWITVSPANGPASATCTVCVDSTVTNTPRNGIVRFSNVATGQNIDITVSQDGYGYYITPARNTVEVKHFDFVDDREFEVKVSANVPFDVVIPPAARNWLSCEQPQFNLDRGARPRDIRIKFKWGVNSVPLSRNAQVVLQPKQGWEGSEAQTLNIVQLAAPEIEIGHKGDSIVILSIGRSLGTFQQNIAAEPMANWDNVQLWEETDPGYTPDKKGRVKRAAFQLFQTSEPIPYEVQYLTEAIELVFFSNVNSFLYDLSVGEHICKLEKLQRLTISAYGISELPDEFTNLKNLEWLDLSSNNFSSVPSVLTPEYFPKLHALFLNTCQRGYILDLSNTVSRNLAGFKGPFPRRLLEWENLDTLRLSVNYIEGRMPDMEDYPVRYTAEDCKEMNLPPALIGTPKVLPKAKYFAFNLNRMYGELPDWVLYHPNLTSWGPYALCYPQEGRASDGTAAAFSNIPANMDYYWSFYEGYKEHEDIYIGD